jgi:hypothetical protein
VTKFKHSPPATRYTGRKAGIDRRGPFQRSGESIVRKRSKTDSDNQLGALAFLLLYIVLTLLFLDKHAASQLLS